MSKEVYSVKIEQETKESLKRLIDESGLEGAEFIENLLKLYELNSDKIKISAFNDDILELQRHTKRTFELFLNVINRSESKKEDAVVEFNKQLDIIKVECSELSKLNSNFKNEINELKSEIKKKDKSNETLSLELKQLHDNISTRKDYVEELKSNNLRLQESINNLEHIKAENIELKNQKNEFEKEFALIINKKDKEFKELIDKGISDLSEKNKIIDDLNNCINFIKNDNKIQLFEQKEVFQEEIFNLKSSHQKEFIDLSIKYQQDLENNNREHLEKYKTLLNDMYLNQNKKPKIVKDIERFKKISLVKLSKDK